MARKTTSPVSPADARIAVKNPPRYCSIAEGPPRAFAPGMDAMRLSLIELLASKWVNGTVLKYCFVDRAKFRLEDGTTTEERWPLVAAQMNAVRAGFQRWSALGIGIGFQEVAERNMADVRIGFLDGAGSWSYVGRDIRGVGIDELTMNFGWDIAADVDTATHEIGHTIGLPHEHQNPFSGIVWDEEAVYRSLALPPNRWSRDKTYFNIIRKIKPDAVQGSAWDPDSIMHYPFDAGMIVAPAPYRNGLTPAGGISQRDAQWIKTFYPAQGPAGPAVLDPLKAAQLALNPGQQSDFELSPQTTREYEIRTFGTADTVIVLFESTAGGPVYVAGDDDSGEDRNSYLKLRLIGGRRYVLRVRLYYEEASGTTALMYW